MIKEQKKIMILGGGENQEVLIKTAKKLQYYTVVCDKRAQLNGVAMADKHIAVDYMDREKVLMEAEKNCIDGIISNSESAMLNVAYVSQKLGLPGNSVESIENLLSREKFRALQRKVGVYAPIHYVADSLEQLLNVTAEMEYPIIIKPTKSSGTRGTTKVSKYDQDVIQRAYRVCKEFSRDGKVAAEEYVEMNCLRVNDADIFVIGDEILWDGFLWEDRSPDSPMLPMTEIFPLALDERDLCLFKETVSKIVKASGITLGEYNVETYFTPEHETFVIEINPRQAGNFIPLLIKEHTGVDLTKLLVSTAVADMSYYEELKSFERENNFITCQVVFAKRKGIYNGLNIDPEIKKYIQWIREEVSIGEEVVKGENASDALAFVDLKFDTYENQHKYTDQIEKYIYAKIK